MADFLLEWHCCIDAGRVYLPPQCQQWYSNGVVLRYWPEDKCIGAWPAEELDDANKLHLDSRGRLLVPVRLRREAGIEGSAVLTCIKRYMDIFSEKSWRSYIKSCLSEYENGVH